nr:hypothetical protein [Mycoplasmopsis bovis]
MTLSQKNDEFDEQIKSKALSLNKVYIQVINKKDLVENIDNNLLYVSAKQNDLDELKEKLVSVFKNIDLNNDQYVNNSRQLALIKQAQKSLDDALNSIENGYDPDVVIIDLRQAMKSSYWYNW